MDPNAKGSGLDAYAAGFIAEALRAARQRHMRHMVPMPKITEAAQRKIATANAAKDFIAAQIIDEIQNDLAKVFEALNGKEAREHFEHACKYPLEEHAA
jgi:hypothetical protein